MKSLKIKLVFSILIAGIIIGCKKDDGISVPLQNEINEFVWFGMNGYYYWVDEIDDLSLNKYSTYNELYTFLNNYSDPEGLFDDLLFQDDRFSWIVDDYEELEASFQGVAKSFGYELGLLRLSSSSDDLLGYVKYIVPGGPAESAGLERGDLFTSVNGQKLTINNYQDILQSDSYTLNLSEVQNESFTPTGESISMVAIELVENPIFISETLEVDGMKIGYLMYNQFINNNSYHSEMNNVFGQFKSDGITDLVLDLRYNGGGSITTSRILSSMIYGQGSSSDIIGSIIYNDNLSSVNTDLTFLSAVPIFDSDGNQTSSIPMNRLNLNRVFILISGSSASASEFVIAGLLPYMNVTLIGTTSVGKNVGSITLYDSPKSGYVEKGADLNPNHKYAMQPIISQLANSEGFTDYIDGFDPNIEVDEVDYLGEFMPLGDPSEPLLAAALEVITGNARISRKPDNGMVAIPNLLQKEYLRTIYIDDENIPSNVRTYLDDIQ